MVSLPVVRAGGHCARGRPPGCRCGHCKSLKPTWIEAASELVGKVKVGAVDCTVHQSICQEYGVQVWKLWVTFPHHSNIWVICSDIRIKGRKVKQELSCLGADVLHRADEALGGRQVIGQCRVQDSCSYIDKYSRQSCGLAPRVLATTEVCALCARCASMVFSRL